MQPSSGIVNYIEFGGNADASQSQFNEFTVLLGRRDARCFAAAFLY